MNQELQVHDHEDVELIVNHSVDGIVVTDANGIVVYTNPAAEELFGRTGEEFRGIEFGFPVMPGESVEVTVYRKQLGHRVVELRSTGINWHGSRGLLVSLRDITERKSMEQEILAREEEKTYLMENIADAVITIDENGIITSANDAAARIFSYDKEELVGYCANNLVAETEGWNWNEWLEQAAPGGDDTVTRLSGRRFSGRRSDGSEVALEVSASWIDVHNKRGYILSARDITPRVEAERKLHIVSTAIDQSLLAKLIIDRDGSVEYANRKFIDLTGVPQDCIHGHHFMEVLNMMGVTIDVPNKLARISEEGASYENQYYYNYQTGEKFWVEQYTSPIRNSDGEITHFLISLEDVTQKINLTQQLEEQSIHDNLTGLLNRAGVRRLIDSLVQEENIDLDEYYLFYINIDQFSIINDTCGNADGDRFLVDVADILRDAAAQPDTIARLDADAYLMVKKRLTREEAAETARSLNRSVRKMRFVSMDKVFNPTATVSCLCLDQWRQFRNAAVLIQRCITGSNIAKEYGGDQFYFIQEQDEKLAQYQQDTFGASLVHKALDQELFCLYAQPIREVGGETDQHFYELLIRMKDGDKMIPPARFLMAAEKFKLGTRIDQWVINHAFAWLADNPEHTDKLGHCGINISAESLATASLIRYIVEKIEEYGIPPEKICIEVTETAAVKNLEVANGNLRRLKDLGCRIALDDFGTGMSSFNYLKQLDIDYLKIDGAFIKNLKQDPVDFAMVSAIRDVGKVMGVKTIAEFVEDEETLSILRLVGIDYAQGFGIGKPAFFC